MLGSGRRSRWRTRRRETDQASEVDADALAFPVAVAGRLGALGTADLLGQRLLRRLRLLRRRLGSRRGRRLLRLVHAWEDGASAGLKQPGPRLHIGQLR